MGSHPDRVIESDELFWRFARTALEQLREEAEHAEVEKLEEWLYNDGPAPACIRRGDSYA